MSESSFRFLGKLIAKIGSFTIQKQSAKGGKIPLLFSSTLASQSFLPSLDLKNIHLKPIFLPKNPIGYTDRKIWEAKNIFESILPKKTLPDLGAEKQDLMNFIIHTLDKNDVVELIHYGLTKKSPSILSKCFNFIQTETNVLLRDLEFATLSIEIGKHNSDDDIEAFKIYLPTLIETIGKDNLEITLKPGPAVNRTNLKAFLKEYGQCLSLSSLLRD